MKRHKKLAVALVSALLSTVLFTGGIVGFAEESEVQFPTYVQDFSSVDAVNADFDAGYVGALGNSTKSEQVGLEDGHWFIEDEKLVRKNDIDAAAGTWRAALLTYNKQLFTNFQLEVDYLQGPSSYWWTAVIFRQSESKNMFDDGAGIFVQEGGQMTMWGAIGVGGPFEKTPAIPNYDRNAWHHMKLTVQGNSAKLQIDDEQEVEWTLQEVFYREGYVTLASINNDSQFDNFKITELPEPEEVDHPDIPPIDEADTDDALGNLATKEDDEEKVERPLDYSNAYGEQQEAPKGSGCNGSVTVTGGIILSAGLLALAITGLKRKE